MTNRPSAVDVDRAASVVDATEMLNDISVLASDEFEGRCPGTVGEVKTVDYLVKRFSEIGLKSFSTEKKYLQPVPLVGCFSTTSLVLNTKNGPLNPTTPADYMIISRKLAPKTFTRSDLVFVGYGVDAPEFDWDDYKTADLEGKILVYLIGDPPVKAAGSGDSKLDPDMFNGDALSYFGRWTYKFEAAAAHGAAGAVIVHETKEAGYPFDVVRNTWSGERFELGAAPNPCLEFEGWISSEFARMLFEGSGMDFAELKKSACDKNFEPVPLFAEAICEVSCKMRSFNSQNCIAYIEGSDAELKKEAIMYIAHWDHFGPDKASDGRQFFTGAVDNGSGIGCLLAIAKAFASLETAPHRSIIFMAPTAEEHNLLGARHYVAHPLSPVNNTVAVINMDCMNVWGRTKSIISVLDGKSTLDNSLHKLAAQQDRRVLPDQVAEKGFAFRSDHLVMMQKGVPSLLFLQPGTDYVGQQEGFGQKLCDEYFSSHYHKVSDKVTDTWDLSGLVEDAQLLFRLGLTVSNDAQRPLWLPNATKGMGFSS